MTSNNPEESVRLEQTVFHAVMRLFLPFGEPIPINQLLAATGLPFDDVYRVCRSHPDLRESVVGWRPTADSVRRYAWSILETSNLQSPFIMHD